MQKLTIIIGTYEDVYPIDTAQHFRRFDYPENGKTTLEQFEMARIIGRAVNNGERVVLVTNSDNIIAEINNLIILSNSKSATWIVPYFPEYQHSACFIKPEDIACYDTFNGSSYQCEIDPTRGIDVKSINYAIERLVLIRTTIFYSDDDICIAKDLKELEERYETKN